MNSFIINNGRDVDTRPKTYPCRHCARDVESGTHCKCVASTPFFVKPKDPTLPPVAFIIRP